MVATSGCLADTKQLKVQGPWGYIKQSADTVSYMATTPAAEDGNIWFLIICGPDERVSASIMDSDGFPYHLQQPLLRVKVQIDNSSAVSMQAAPVNEKQIMIDPRLTHELVPIWFGAKK
jgi:hypothetical protein